MININATLDTVFSLGRQDENEYRQVNFDITDLLADMDLTSAEVVCLLKRPDQVPIICNDFSYDLTEKTAVLTVTSTETAYAGRCKLELDLVIDDVVGKTQIYSCNVLPSLSASETCDSTIPWVAEVLSASTSAAASATAAQTSANNASASATEAQTIADSLTSTIGEAVADYLEEHPISVPVNSVNGQTGTVVLSASDVGALDDSTVIPTKTSQLTNDSGFITNAGVTSFNGNTGAVTYTAPVTSVNSKTGAVVLDASDVGALSDSTTIPSKTSDLTNDSGFITDAGVTSFNGNTGAVTYTAPVTSVNGNTGAVSLEIPSNASDITNDSAVTGANVDDALNTLNTQITNVSNAVFIENTGNVSLTLGTLSLSNGGEEASNTRARTDFITFDEDTQITAETGGKFAFRFYDSNGTWVGAPAVWYSTATTVSDIASSYSGATQMRLVCAYTDDRDLQDSTVLSTLETLISLITTINRVEVVYADYQSAISALGA